MVCAMVVNGSRCPIDFEFSFVMSTRMRTAGTYIDVYTCSAIILLMDPPPPLSLSLAPLPSPHSVPSSHSPHSVPPSPSLLLPSPPLLSLFPELGRDYIHTDDVVTIAKCGRAACTRVAIIDDVSLENVEKFVVTVEANSSLIPHVIFEDTQAVVTITDNDGIYIHTYNDCIIVDSMYMCHVCSWSTCKLQITSTLSRNKTLIC